MIFCGINVYAEDVFGNSKISGTFQLEMPSYKADSIIEAPAVNESVLSNGFLWLNYSSNNFQAEIRYENYMNPLLGIDKRYKGNGIAFRKAKFTSDIIDITAGNFYEQFGSGMIFRSYEERALGLDNAMDGLKVNFRPVDGIEIVGLIGKQRKFWTLGEGIVRGGDINIGVNNLFGDDFLPDYQIELGSSVISKYQADNSSVYYLPENSFAWSSRFSVTSSDFSLQGEYGYKNPDPSAANDFNFNPGKALLLSASYYTSGLGLTANFHKNDNMDFRSDRNELGNVLLLNFLPPLTKQHLYALASMYPYATQLNGEIGYQAELTYSVPKRTLIGGHYGTTINMNFSQVNSIVKNPTNIDSTNGHIYTYDSPFLEFGDRVYFREFLFSASRKVSKKFKFVFQYLNQLYDRDVMEAEGAAEFGKVHTNILISELTYSFTRKYALRMELQHLWAKQDSLLLDQSDVQDGNWAMALAEFTVSPHWYFSITDQWNYGNKDEERQIHYFTGAITYSYDATRISLNYGKQRSGIICVGGVCRQVPASNGFYLAISSSF